jgi:uncharacterized protein
MSRLCIAIAIIAISITSALPIVAAEFGTRNEAVAMVKRVQEKFRKDGPDVTFRAIDSKAREFWDRDLFPFVLDFTGLCVASPQPALRGKNLLDLKDQDGKFVIQEAVSIAKGPGRGWSDTRFFDPRTKAVEDKSAYIERMGNFLVGVGVYKNEQPNENTIGLISGSPNSDDTYLRMAYDLAEVLNDGDNLRILPIVGIGGSRNIRDVRYLKGVDIGLTQTNILNNFRRSNERMGQVDDKIVYIAKLFNEETHLIARPNISSLAQLQGLKVNLDAKGSGTSYTMRDVFKNLEIEIEEVNVSQSEAFEKIKSGEIAATVLIAGKPVQSVAKLKLSDGLHFVPLPYPKQLIADYLPTTLTHEDYPEMIPSGESVDTIAVGAVLIAYKWPKKNVDRYGRVQRFVEAFFSKIADFQKPPRDLKWREVNIAATLPGWTRFEAAQAWLDKRAEQLAEQRPNINHVADPIGTGSNLGVRTETSRQDRLYQEFLRWKQLRRNP